MIGAVPTGVEMAGQIAELARDTLRSYFRSADPRSGRILLIEAADRVLTAFPPSLSARDERSLRKHRLRFRVDAGASSEARETLASDDRQERYAVRRTEGGS